QALAARREHQEIEHPVQDIHVVDVPEEAHARLQPETSAMSLEPRAPGAVPCHERGEDEALPNQHGAGVEEEVHALLLTQASDYPDDGPRETGCESGEAGALRSAASRRERQRRGVDESEPGLAL